MNTKFLSTVAAIALLSGTAFAQTTNSTTETDVTSPPVTSGADATASDTPSTTEGAAETETETDAAEGDAAMPAEGAAETDAAEGDASVPAGDAATDAAEGDAAMPAEGAAETDAAEGDAAIPVEGDAATDAAEGDAAMPAEGDAATDAAEGDAAMPAEGAAETDAAEGDAAMPAEGAETETATDDSAEEDRAARFGDFADAAVSDVVGMDVLSANGDDLGEVDDLIMDGDAVMAIIGVGGFLGLGEHKIALPLADLTMGEDALQVGDMTKEDLEALPEYDGEAESLPVDTTVSGEPIAQEGAVTDPATGAATAPTGG